MEKESRKSEWNAMRQESGGEEWLVSCCGDSDVVDVDEGDGDGGGEGRGGKEAGDANLQKCRKRSFRTCSVRSPYTLRHLSMSPASAT